MTKEKEFRLIEKCEVDCMRKEAPWFEKRIAIERATCRICGRKIAKGFVELVFPYSFTDGGYNAWTAVECHVHRECS